MPVIIDGTNGVNIASTTGVINLLGSTSGTLTIAAPAVAGTNTLTLPASTGAVVLDSATQTLTNKTIQGGAITQRTVVASTSGTSIDFNSIPSWVKRITVMLNGVSTSGTSNIQIQIGSGSIETTSYVAGAGFAGGSTGSSTSTTGFILTSSFTAASTLSVIAVICNQTSNTWTESFSGAYGSGTGAFGGGYKSLSGVLDRVRITTVNGTDTFDAGSINIFYE